MATPATTANTGDAYIVKAKSSIGKTYIGGIVFKNQTQLDPTQQQIIEFKRALIALNPGIMGSSLEANENQINKTLNEQVGEKIIIPKSLIIGEETVNGKSTENTQTNEESHDDNPSKDPDGEKTVIETKSDGSQTVTQTNKDGTIVTSEREKEPYDEFGNRTDVDVPSFNRITADDDNLVVGAKKEAQAKMTTDDSTVNDPKAGTAEAQELATERKAIKDDFDEDDTSPEAGDESDDKKDQNPSSVSTDVSSQRDNNNTPTVPKEKETRNIDSPTNEPAQRVVSGDIDPNRAYLMNDSNRAVSNKDLDTVDKYVKRITPQTYLSTKSKIQNPGHAKLLYRANLIQNGYTTEAADRYCNSVNWSEIYGSLKGE